MSTIQPFRAKRVKRSTVRVRPVERPDAAGIDLGATVHFVAVPPERLMRVTLCGPNGAVETLAPVQVVIELQAEVLSETVDA